MSEIEQFHWTKIGMDIRGNNRVDTMQMLMNIVEMWQLLCWASNRHYLIYLNPLNSPRGYVLLIFSAFG